MCSKYLKKDKLVIGIDVNQTNNNSMFGVNIRLHGDSQASWSWAEKFAINQEKLPPETILLIFNKIWEKLAELRRKPIQVLLLRDFPGKRVFEEEMKTIRTTQLYE